MTEDRNRFAELPPEVPATELVQVHAVDTGFPEVPLGPEGGGDGD